MKTDRGAADRPRLHMEHDAPSDAKRRKRVPEAVTEVALRVIRAKRPEILYWVIGDVAKEAQCSRDVAEAALDGLVTASLIGLRRDGDRCVWEA